MKAHLRLVTASDLSLRKALTIIDTVTVLVDWSIVVQISR